MTPYEGINLHIFYPSKESFNFWHSPLRITIERAFGIFVQRWGILWKPLQVPLHHSLAIVQALVRLHNFVNIHSVATLHTKYTPPAEAEVDEGGRLRSNAWRENARPFPDVGGYTVGNLLREKIKEKIEQFNLMHPRSHRLQL